MGVLVFFSRFFPSRSYRESRPRSLGFVGWKFLCFHRDIDVFYAVFHSLPGGSTSFVRTYGRVKIKYPACDFLYPLFCPSVDKERDWGSRGGGKGRAYPLARNNYHRNVLSSVKKARKTRNPHPTISPRAYVIKRQTKNNKSRNKITSPIDGRIVWKRKKHIRA